MDQKGRNIGLYIKFLPEMGEIVRLEFRTSGADRCHTRGMSQMSDLLRFTVDDLAALLDHEIWLAVFDGDKARRLIADQARKEEDQISGSLRDKHKFALDRAGLRRRYERHLCAIFCTEEDAIPDWEDLGSFPAQAIADWMPFLDAALRRVPPSAYLISTYKHLVCDFRCSPLISNENICQKPPQIFTQLSHFNSLLSQPH
jgi:hypothetical protein